MKRNVLLLAFIVAAMAAFSQNPPYQGVAPEDITDGDYYLYNVETGLWLGDNHTNEERYTSRAELGTRGMDFALTSMEGGYRLNPKLGHNHSLNAGNLYMDTDEAVTVWTITPAEDVENGVKIASGAYRLGADESGRIVNNADSRDTWLIVTRAERMLTDTKDASADNPADLSWAIYGGTFPIADERRKYWQGAWGSNNVTGDELYHCNRVWEMWGIKETEVFQELSGLPDGRYAVSAQAFYSPSPNNEVSADHLAAFTDGTEQTAGYVFAGDARVPMTNIYTLVSNERRDRFNTKDLGGGQYMPDGIQQYANHMFEGKGQTQEAIVNVDRGRLRLGVTVDDGTGKSWIIFDNFRLTYLGKDDTQTEEPEKIAGISDVRYREGDRAHLCITFDGSEDLAFEHGTAGLVTITDTEGRKVAHGTSATNCFDDEWHHTSVRLTLSKALPKGEYTLNIPQNSLLLKELGYDVYRLPLSITFNNNETEEGDGDNSEPETETERQQTYADGIRIAWQYNRQRYIGGGSYGRAIRLDNGKYVMVYSTGGSNIGGNNYIRWQEQPYGDWSEATVTRAQDEYHTNKNAEIIELKDGRLMYAWLHRTNYENSQGPSKIMAAYSSDGGKTWQNEQVIYTATDTYGLGVWEPAMIQLPTGELQIYFANEASAGGGTQNISMRRSYNGGRSWQPGTEIVSYRSGSRDGMPVPVYLKDRKGIAVAIEDPGFMGTFKPMVVHTDAADNWTSGTVDGNSAHRWSIFASSKDYLPSEVYCGQPYLIQLSTGETVYSAASGEDRNPDTSDTHGRMAVYVGDSDARNFIARSFPFPFVENTGARAIWNSIMQYNDSTLMAVCTVEGNVEQSGIWTNEGKIIRPIASMQTGTERKWDSLPHELFIGAESQAEACIRSLWDNDSIYFRFEVKDRQLNLSDNMHETDGVEVFISTVEPTSARKYNQYRLRVDAKGRVEKQYGSGARWIADDAVNTCGHVETGADGYTIVVAVPWQEIGGKPAGEELYCCYQLHNTDKTGGKTATVDETLSGSDIDDATTWMRMPLEKSPDTGTGIESVTVREKENGDSRTYNIMGQEVDEHAKGIIISKGKKMLRK